MDHERAAADRGAVDPFRNIFVWAATLDALLTPPSYSSKVSNAEVFTRALCMRSDPQRVAADAANHLTVGLLQGTGFALAGVIVGLVTSVVLRHPTGFLAGIAVFVWLFMRAKERNRSPKYLEPGRPDSGADDRR
jgi:hypothetical protein